MQCIFQQHDIIRRGKTTDLTAVSCDDINVVFNNMAFLSPSGEQTIALTIACYVGGSLESFWVKIQQVVTQSRHRRFYLVALAFSLNEGLLYYMVISFKFLSYIYILESI